jgi:LCP family protein required for cell wall assembly
MFRARTGMAIAGKAGYGVCCIFAALTLLGSGFAYYVKSQIDSIGGSNAITSGPQTGAMNILLMGLESRTDWDGNILPEDLLKAMHAGSVQGVEDGVGGQDTNTLILIHIYADAQKAVGFSIPRDDWVTFPQPYDGQSQGKIDQAYGLAWAQSLQATVDSKMSTDQRYLLANEAGQTATIDTVEQLTGVHVDHFAEVNLLGFYELAKAFNGIEVCLKSWNGGENLHDANSGFNAPHAGYLYLQAGQALAFVRERDNLPNGDLDRTHRQQAVIDYVVWKLEHEGFFTDLGKITNLLAIAKKYVITDSDWQIFSFATEMRSLTGSRMTFYTAPVVNDDGEIDNQTVNIIDPAQIKAVVQRTFYPPPSPKHAAKKKQGPPAPSLTPAQTTVDVYNGGAPAGMAAAMSQALTHAGYKPGHVGNTTPQSSTQVLYGAGAQTSAEKIANAFDGVTATASSSVLAGNVVLLLASDATSVPSDIGTAPTSPSSSSSSSPSPSSTAPSANAAGGPVTVKSNAPYGIPCVY